MRLLYFIPALYNSGGMERVLTEKVNYLIENYNYEIIIITTDQMGKSIYFPIHDKVKLIHLDIDFSGHFNKSFFQRISQHYKKINLYKKHLMKIIPEINPDICISLCGKEIEFLYKIKTAMPKIAELHFSMNFRKQFLLSQNKNIFWIFIGDYRTWQLKKQTKHLDKLVVLTKEDEKNWIKTHKNIVQIYNPNVIKTHIYSNVKNKTVVAVGRLTAQKGYEYLIDAWKILANKYPDWILNIWGEGELRGDLQNQIERYGLSENIFLRGATDNIKREYIDNSIFAITSLYEGFGMVIVEAMSCGLPCVSFDCECGPNEIIEENKNGFLVSVGDVKSFADRLSLLMEDENLRIKMSKESILRSKKFDEKAIMKQWDNLFHELVNQIKN